MKLIYLISRVFLHYFLFSRALWVVLIIECLAISSVASVELFVITHSYYKQKSLALLVVNHVANSYQKPSKNVKTRQKTTNFFHVWQEVDYVWFHPYSEPLPVKRKRLSPVCQGARPVGWSCVLLVSCLLIIQLFVYYINNFLLYFDEKSWCGLFFSSVKRVKKKPIELKAIQFKNWHEILTSMYFPPKFEFLNYFFSWFLPSKCF